MIENSRELTVTIRQLRIMEDALKALREQLDARNPELLAVTEKAYARRIEALQNDISAYLCDHPTDVSLLMRLSDDFEPTPKNELMR